MNRYFVRIGEKPLQYDEQTELSSDAFIHGNERLGVMLSMIYTMMIRHGYHDISINKTIIRPIPKDKRKSLSNSDNYRGIAPNNSIIKVLDYVILDQFQNVFDTSDNQFAYKSEFSTHLCTFLAIETIQYYIQEIPFDFSNL